MALISKGGPLWHDWLNQNQSHSTEVLTQAEFWSKHDGLLWSELIANFFQLKKCHWNFPWLVPLVSTLQRCPLMDFLRSFLSFLTIFWCLRTEVRAAWENSQHFVTPPVVSSPNDLWTQACSDFNNNNCHTNREWSLCGLRNECRNFTWLTCHYPDLDSVSDWLKQIFLATQPTRSTRYLDLHSGWFTSSVWNFLQAFLRQTSFREEAGKKMKCWFFSQARVWVVGVIFLLE